MSDVFFVVFSEDETCPEALKKLLEMNARARVSACVTDEEQLEAVIARERPYALLVDLGRAPHVMLDRLTRISAPPGGVIVCGPKNDSAVILRALKQGIREFLSDTPTGAEISEVVDRLAAELKSAATAGQASVIAVVGAKGGVGATMVACQVAANLQLAGQRTVVVDLNLPMGDVALHFDLHPTYTLSDAIHAPDQIDGTFVAGLLQKHRPTGLEILAAPDRVEDTELIEEPLVEAVMAQLRTRFDRVVVDVSRSWSPISVKVLEMADTILIVTLKDVPALKHARAHRDLMLRLGVSPSRIRTVINRHETNAGVSDPDVARFLGASPDFCLPNDYATAIHSVNDGRPITDIASGSEIDSAFRTLTSRSFEWLGLEPPAAFQNDVKRKPWGRNLIQKLAGKA